MLARLTRSRARAALAVAVCAPLFFMSHATPPARAASSGGSYCAATVCHVAHATFINPNPDVLVLILPDGFIVLTDLSAVPLAPTFVEAAPAVFSNGGLVEAIPDAHVPPYILAIVGPDGKYHPAPDNFLRPGFTYVITTTDDQNCAC
jgi:hypothetical protein